MTTIKIFQMDECTWFIGHSLDSCIAAFQKEIVGDDPELVEDARQVPEEDLDKTVHSFVGEFENVFQCRTFRDELALQIAAGGEFPRLFSSAEY